MFVAMTDEMLTVDMSEAMTSSNTATSGKRYEKLATSRPIISLNGSATVFSASN